MASQRTPFVGVYPAIPTPFDESRAIDYETVRRHVRFLEAAGVDGIVPAGSTGESSTLSHDEHIELIEFVVDVAEEAAVIGGTGSNSTREALSLSRRAVDAGVDALLLISPYYNLPEPKGMEDHYRTIADEVDAPQIIYNVPGRTGRNIAVDTAASLATHENIVGYKAASADLERISEVIERTQAENFSVLSGDDPLTLPILNIGGTGVISVAGNVVPEQVRDLVDSALDGDYEHARDRHHELGPLFRAMFVETNPIPVKEAMKMLGLGNANFRPPLTPAEDEVRERIRTAFDGFR